MKLEWKSYLAAETPAYTSYPTSHGFSDAIGAAALEKRLSGVGQYEPISLYINSPFENAATLQTATHSDTSDVHETARRYVKLLTRQIFHVGQLLQGRGRLTALHFAGAAPHVLLHKDLGVILDAVEMAFGLTDSAIVSMDIDTRLVSFEMAEALGALGLSRIKLGVQDFDPDVQKAIGRVQTFSHIGEVMNAFRRFGVFDINLELGYGLPRQTKESFARTLSLAVSLSPECITLRNGAAPSPSLAATQTQPDTLSLRLEQPETARRILTAAGYECVGFDHFAKTQTALAKAAQTQAIKYNLLGLNADPARIVLGIGQAAVSQFDDLLVQNHSGIDAYISCVERDILPAMRGATLSREDRLRARIIEALLSTLNANILDICNDFDLDLAVLRNAFGKIEMLRNVGLVTYKDGKMLIPEEARAFANVVAACFDENLSKIRHLSYAI